MSKSEFLRKSLALLTAQSNGTALAAGFDPNSGSYTGDTGLVLNRDISLGSENCYGADTIKLHADVTTAPTTAGSLEVWYAESLDGTNYTRWRYSHTVGEEIDTSVARYDAGEFELRAMYTQLQLVARDYALTVSLLGVPELMGESQ